MSARGAEKAAEPSPAAGSEKREPTAPAGDLEEFVFILDPRQKRRVVVHAPHDLTKKELKRIEQWMKIQFVLDDEEEPAPAPQCPPNKP